MKWAYKGESGEGKLSRESKVKDIMPLVTVEPQEGQAMKLESKQHKPPYMSQEKPLLDFAKDNLVDCRVVMFKPCKHKPVQMKKEEVKKEPVEKEEVKTVAEMSPEELRQAAKDKQTEDKEQRKQEKEDAGKAAATAKRLKKEAEDKEAALRKLVNPKTPEGKANIIQVRADRQRRQKAELLEELKRKHGQPICTHSDGVSSCSL